MIYGIYDARFNLFIQIKNELFLYIFLVTYLITLVLRFLKRKKSVFANLFTALMCSVW